METCGNCKHWDTTGFGLRDGPKTGVHRAALVGKCQLVAWHWYPYSPNKMIALSGTKLACLGSDLMAVITRREFGCNQFQQWPDPDQK